MADIEKIKIGNTEYNVKDVVSGYITGIDSTDVTTALGYTPYNSSNPNGYTSNVGTVTSVNGNTPNASGEVTVSVPTVNDATLTITQGGTTKGTFTANASSNVTIDLDAGGGGASALSDLSDVTISSATNGQLLKYNGSKWANSTVSIPSVYNGTLTITQGGVSKGTFTANASSDKTIALDAGAYTAGTGITLSGGAISIQQEDLGTGDRYIWDATEVGTLTKNDGIYSGFSINNYLLFPHIPTSMNSLEMSFTFHTYSNVNTWQVILGQSSTNRTTPQVEIENGYAQVLYSTDGSAWDDSLKASVTTNTTYTITAIWNGSAISGTLKNVDTGTITQLSPYSTGNISSVNWTQNAKIGVDQNDNGSKYLSSIDLHKSYIKVNGELFYMHQTSIAKATNSLYGLVKPDGTTITVNDGVISATSEIPSQTGNSGKFLTTDGSSASWASISIPTVDQTYNSSSTNAQSGAAIAGAGFLANTAMGTSSLTLLGTAINQNNSINIGAGSAITDTGIDSNIQDIITLGNNSTVAVSGTDNILKGGIVIGRSASISVSGTEQSSSCPVVIGNSASAVATEGIRDSITIGNYSSVAADRAIQIGRGTNSTNYSLKIGFGSSNNYQLLDGTTGLIPDARISSNIARTSAIPTESTVSSWGFTKNTGTVTSVNNTSPVNGNVSLTIPTVNDATLTITQGGTTKGTFTANASSNVTIDLDAGGSGGTEVVFRVWS